MNDLKNAGEGVKTAVNAVEKEPISLRQQKKTPRVEVDRKRRELIRLSEDGGILTQSVAFLKKSSAKIINKVYAEYENRRLERANLFLTDH